MMDEMQQHEEIVQRDREQSGVAAGEGPDDDHVWAGVQGVVAQFDYGYLRVMRDAPAKLRSLIIGRRSPFSRRVALVGKEREGVAARVVEDYDQRNFVTAGGWALEEIAVEASPDGHNSAARGIDTERIVGGGHHLYVLKSGPIS